MPTNQASTVQSVLQNTFHLESFRDGQQEIVESVLNGHDTLVFMPTGGGKSLTYQLPGMVREGLAIVITPLISLMKDQVDKLRELGIRAECVNSTVSPDEQRRILESLEWGDGMGFDESPGAAPSDAVPNAVSPSAVKFLYIAPERLNSSAFQRMAQNVKIALVAIDEAHCISQWWHDFRPSYMRIREFLARLRTSAKFPVIALTATATKKVREDIVERLGLRTYRTFTRGFDRKNLVILVREISAKADKLQKMLEIVTSVPGSGIVYCSSRKVVGEVYDFLDREGISVGMYTGAMAHDDRDSVQNTFMSGETKVMVATNAFGMGIDKKDIRFVIHYNLPGSIENYYQEIGRAWRDGKRSFVGVLASYGDTKIQEFFIANSHPDRSSIIALYESIYDGFEMGEGAGHTIQKTLAVLAKEALLDSAAQASSIIRTLEKYGIVDRGFEGESEEGFRGRGMTLVLPKMPADQLPIDWDKQSLLEEEAYFKLEQIKKLLFFPSCRKRFILEYFGDEEDLAQLGDNCGSCDYCIEKDKYLSGSAATLVPLSVFEIVLDAVFRYDGRFGGKTMADYLLGKSDAKMAERDMDSDPNFGVLREYSSALVTAVIEALFRNGYLGKAAGLYPVLSCAYKGRYSLGREEVLKSELESLQSAVAMKIQGDAFRKSQKSPKSKKAKQPKSPSKAASGDTFETTLGLFQSGMGIKEAASERDMSPVTIEGHAIRLFASGRLVSEDLLRLANAKNVELAIRVIRTDFPAGTNALKPIKELLATQGWEKVSYFDIKVALALEGLDTGA